MSEHTSDHHRRATVLTLGATAVGALGAALVLGILAALAGVAWLGVLVGLLAGAGAVTWWLRGTESRVLAAVGATPLPPGAEPRLRNLVDGLCATSGLPVPHLAVVADPGVNALSVGRSPEHTTLVFTRGLLDGLDRIELEGVVARQLAQVRQGQVPAATAAVPFAGVAPGLVARVLPDRYDVRADLDGVGLTRYPPGLTRALEKTRARSGVTAAPRSTSHLWFDDPSPAGGEPAGIAHSPIDERIATLQEL